MVVRRLTPWRLLQLLRPVSRKGVWTEVKQLVNSRLLPIRIAKGTEENPSPPALFEMATAYWISQAIYVAAKLGIADLLKEGPQSCVALATATGSDAPSLFRLMRALSSVGIFSQLGRDRFALSRLAESLQTEIHGSLRSVKFTTRRTGTFFIAFKPDLRHSTMCSLPAYSTTCSKMPTPLMRLIRVW